MMVRINLAERNFHLYNKRNHIEIFFASAGRKIYAKILKMSEPAEQEILQQFGKRVQRCYGCYISYYLKDMYLGEDVTFYCEHCKDETMFHFDQFSALMDISKLREIADAARHH